MPNQQSTRPFLSNFLAAFRAQSLPQPTSKTTATSTSSPSNAAAAAAASATHPSNSSPSHPRTITATSKSHTTTSALSALHSPPLSRSPGTSTSPGYMTRDPVSGAMTSSNIGGGGRSGRRRGSDSSNEGFRDVVGGEKWYIGGRTAAGEERFFKLGVVRRDRSLERASTDRLSL